MSRGPGVTKKKVIVYRRPGCPLCKATLHLLEYFAEHIEVEERSIDEPRWLKELETCCPGWTSIPQVVVNGKMLGTFTDLTRLDLRGELQPLLT